jgi:hypothetical protein
MEETSKFLGDRIVGDTVKVIDGNGVELGRGVLACIVAVVDERIEIVVGTSNELGIFVADAHPDRRMKTKVKRKRRFISLSPQTNLSPNPTQMRILKRIFVFQAVAEDAVEAGVSEQDRPCEHQPGDGK